MNEIKDIELTGFDNVFKFFSSSKEESVYVVIPLDHLHEFKDHPFRVEDNKDMAELVKSVKEHGIFKRRELQVLVGMKCLDEGIDIKNARVAILMANSTNPREYVQRVGRVIRTMPGKEMSEIYDLIVLPDENVGSGMGILEKEARRTKQIAVNAVNYEEVITAFEEKGVLLYAD